MVYELKRIVEILEIQHIDKRATDLRKSMKTSAKDVDSSQVNKERTFHIHLSVESFSASF